MHEFCKYAQESLAAAHQKHKERLAQVEELERGFAIDPKDAARARKANPNFVCIEVDLAEWRKFLIDNRPPENQTKACEIHRALCQGAAGAGSVPSVFVQAIDVLALHEACGGKAKVTTE